MILIHAIFRKIWHLVLSHLNQNAKKKIVLGFAPQCFQIIMKKIYKRRKATQEYL